MMKRIASAVLLAGAAAGMLTVGTGSASAAALGNTYIGHYSSSSECQFWASVFNMDNNEQQGVTSTYYFCGSNNNLWHRD